MVARTCSFAEVINVISPFKNPITYQEYAHRHFNKKINLSKNSCQIIPSSIHESPNPYGAGTHFGQNWLLGSLFFFVQMRVVNWCIVACVKRLWESVPSLHILHKSLPCISCARAGWQDPSRVLMTPCSLDLPPIAGSEGPGLNRCLITGARSLTEEIRSGWGSTWTIQGEQFARLLQGATERVRLFSWLVCPRRGRWLGFVIAKARTVQWLNLSFS